LADGNKPGAKPIYLPNACHDLTVVLLQNRRPTNIGRRFFVGAPGMGDNSGFGFKEEVHNALVMEVNIMK
jgi:hypothetical protein